MISEARRAFLGLGILLALLGTVLGFVAGVRYRRPDVHWLFVFMAPLFVESPDYFRPEGQQLRQRAWLCLRLALTALALFIIT